MYQDIPGIIAHKCKEYLYQPIFRNYEDYKLMAGSHDAANLQRPGIDSCSKKLRNILNFFYNALRHDSLKGPLGT